MLFYSAVRWFHCLFHVLKCLHVWCLLLSLTFETLCLFVGEQRAEKKWKNSLGKLTLVKTEISSCSLRNWASFVKQRVPDGISQVKSYLLSKSTVESYIVVQSCTAFIRRTRWKYWNLSLERDGWIEGRKGPLICRRKKGMLVGGDSIFMEISLASIWNYLGLYMLWTLLSCSLDPTGQNVQGVLMKVYLAVQWERTCVGAPGAVCPSFGDKMGLSLSLKSPGHGLGWHPMSIEWFGELDCCPNTLSSFSEGEGKRQDQICNALSQ